MGYESVDDPKKEFEKLRKRFNKARAKKKNANISGTSTEEMLEASGGDVPGYKFLMWLEPFISTRNYTDFMVSTDVRP